jgi:hypothetical protein
MTATGDNPDLRPRSEPDATRRNASSNALGNALSALEFHSIETISNLAASERMIHDCDTARFQ